MKNIRIGVLSTANIAQRSVIPAIIDLKGKYSIVGIASRNLLKAKEVAHKFNIKAFASYEAIICKNIIDAIYVPLPNALHYEYVKKALEAGIHVLVEKSLGCNYIEVKELVRLAIEKDLVLMENFQFRFHSQLRFLKDTLHSGDLGEIRMLKAVFGFPPFPDKDNIRYQKELGGGALLDAGAYTTKISQILLGNGLEVEAASLNSTSADEVDTWGGAYLKQESTGIFSSLAFGFDHYYQCGVEVWCSKGKISTNRLFTAPPSYKPVFEVETQSAKQIIELNPDDHFQNMLNHFYKCISINDLKNMENEQNLDQARLIEEIKNKAHGE